MGRARVATAAYFLAIWLTLLAGGRSALFRDPGTFWHVVVGRRVLAGELPVVDEFSFTRRGQPWVASQWLGEAGLALLERAGGFDLLLLAAATFLAALYAWLGGRLVRVGLHWLPAACLLALTLGAASYHFHVRPHLFSLVGLAATLVLLGRVEDGQDRPAALFWLVPLFIVWANVHGGVLAGLGTVGLTVLGWLVAAVARRPGPVRDSRSAAVVTSGCVCLLLAPLVNPYGWDLLRTWRAILTADLPSVIEEHGPLQATSLGGALVLVLGGVYVLAVTAAPPRAWRVTWLLPLVWLWLAGTRIRHGPLFGVAAMVVLADVLPRTRLVAWLERRGSDLFVRPAVEGRQSWRSALASYGPLAAAVGLAATLQLGGIEVPLVGSGWARLDPERWPVELVPDLNAAPEAGHDRVFSDLDDGGFLIFFAPRLAVFIDDRCELYGREMLFDYDHARCDEPARLESWRSEYGFRLALVRTASPFDEYLRRTDGWRVVRSAGKRTLFAYDRP